MDAVGYAIYNLASATEAVNGVPGIEPKGITPDDVTLDGPQGTFLGGGGMEHEHDHHHGGVTEQRPFKPPLVCKRGTIPVPVSSSAACMRAKWRRVRLTRLPAGNSDQIVTIRNAPVCE